MIRASQLTPVAVAFVAGSAACFLHGRGLELQQVSSSFKQGRKVRSPFYGIRNTGRECIRHARDLEILLDGQAIFIGEVAS